MAENDEVTPPIRRYKRRGNQMGLGMVLGAALGAAIGAVIGDLRTWVAIGFGLGILVGGFLQRQARRAR